MSAHGLLQATVIANSLRGGGGGGPRSSSRALHHAVFSLALSRPAFSARSVATRRQTTVLVACVCTIILAFGLSPRTTADAAVIAMSAAFLGSIAFRLALAFGGRNTAPPKPTVSDNALPVYTVLLPVYHEACMLQRLARAIAALDYPKDKLDIKYIVEEDDSETRAAAEALGLVEVIVVPNAPPRTKPKACNYALQFARGKYLVIYDAEDRPERDQLRKSVAAFQAEPDVDCFQARLSIAKGQTWLTKMFELEYGIWFKTLLPGLAHMHAPIPLGGTSNHFRLATLVAAGAWDPFNVTEDADLGLRLARLGYRVSMLDSNTFEEAPRHFRTWMRQRTRWIKGYMQTLLVHTREPTTLLESLGIRGCIVMQAFLGGGVWSALINPWLWLLCILGWIDTDRKTGALDFLAWISGTALLTANGALAVLSLVGTRERIRLWGFLAALSYPIYWLMISFAAYRALWQLVRDPFRWEKTPHGEAECGPK